MQTHRMHVVIPQDHRLVLNVPERIRSGPAELVFVVPSENEDEGNPDTLNAEALARWDAAVSDLAADPRRFCELNQEERRARLGGLRGVGRGLLPSSEEVALSKRQDVMYEERKFGR